MSGPASRSVLIPILLLAAAGLGFGFYHWFGSGFSLQEQPLAGSVQTTPPSIPQITIPAELPLFVLKDINNQPRSIAEWQGKSLVLNFWATWCPPCRREIPLLKTLHAQRSRQDVQVIGIAVDFREDVLAFAQETGIDYPLLLGEQDAMELATRLGVPSGLPFTVFTDKRGRIVALRVGELEAGEANGIIDVVVQIDQNAITLAQGRERIAAIVPPEK